MFATRKRFAQMREYFGSIECGLSDADVWDEVRAEARHEREQWRKALWMIWTTCEDELSCEWPRRVVLRVLCTISMLLWRRGALDYRSLTLGTWDHETQYGGWSCQLLDFDPRRMRYSLGSDGECNM